MPPLLPPSVAFTSRDFGPFALRTWPISPSTTCFEWNSRPVSQALPPTRPPIPRLISEIPQWANVQLSLFFWTKSPVENYKYHRSKGLLEHCFFRYQPIIIKPSNTVRPSEHQFHGHHQTPQQQSSCAPHSNHLPPQHSGSQCDQSIHPRGQTRVVSLSLPSSIHQAC